MSLGLSIQGHEVFYPVITKKKNICEFTDSVSVLYCVKKLNSILNIGGKRKLILTIKKDFALTFLLCHMTGHGLGLCEK